MVEIILKIQIVEKRRTIINAEPKKKWWKFKIKHIIIDHYENFIYREDSF